MAKWLIIAALATIGITALLIGVLYRANRPMLERAKQAQRGDGGDVPPAITVGGMSGRRDADLDNASSDGGSDGGGDGGGGD